MSVFIGLFKGHLVLSDTSLLFSKIQTWGQSLGFAEIGVSSIDLSHTHQALLDWLTKGFHGEMNYMQRHGLLRAHPEELVPGTISVITARMNYLSAEDPTSTGLVNGHPLVSKSRASEKTERKINHPFAHFSDNAEQTAEKALALPSAPPNPQAHVLTDQDQDQEQNTWAQLEWERLHAPNKAYVSLYARGKDYHKSIKKRLEQLAQRINTEVASLGYRVFCDSAPVMEVALAARSGLGWRGKHTLLLNRQAGSMFFLGEIFINFDLLAHTPKTQELGHCGSCTACIDVCPTQAIIAPYQLDARRCISYLTIEHPGAIDVTLRPLMGNRIYGCDDCQLICPWNKFAKTTELADFKSREALTDPTLLSLWQWSEEDFLNHTQASAIRRIGHERWLRNIAIALGNAIASSQDPALKQDIRQALALRLEHPSEVVREHVRWALEQA